MHSPFAMNNSNICERCGYVTLRRAELKVHCNRKHTCKPLLSNICIEDVIKNHWPQDKQPIQCNGCNNRFTTIQNMKRHQSCCKHTKAHMIEIITADSIDELAAANAASDLAIANLNAAKLAVAKTAADLAIANLDSAKLAAAKTAADLAAIKNVLNVHTASTINITNNNTTTNNNTMIINIAPFGVWKEGHMQHIIDNRPFMINCIKNKGVGICDLLRKMHFDEEYPENCNIRKPLKKEAFIDNHNGGRWVTDLPDKVLQKIVHEIGCVLMEFLNANVKHRINDRILKSFMREVGIAMDWDLDASEYELDYNDEINETTRTKTHQKMMQLINKCIYEETQKADQNLTKITVAS